MKKVALILCVAVIAVISLYSFTAIDKYPDDISEDRISMFESHYVKTVENDELNNQLERNFLPLFDKVSSVDAQYSEETGYYYVVFGTKDNQKKIELLIIEKVDFDNETYTYFDFEGFEVTESTEYCYRGALCVGCEYQPAQPCLAICGPYPVACD